MPHQYHAECGALAIRAGLHVLMEKPFTADVEDARMLYCLSRGTRPDLAFLINNTANWQKGSRAAFDAVSSGKIGRLCHINCVFAAPLAWMFDHEEHFNWTRATGTMVGNGFGWCVLVEKPSQHLWLCHLPCCDMDID